MNICFIGTDIGPSVNGAFVRGHVNNVVRLSKELTQMGHKIHIITNMPKFSNPILCKKWMHFADVSCFSTIFPSLKANGPEFAIKALDRVISDSRKGCFDIINVHSGFPALGILSALSKRLTKHKTVHTLYSPFDYSFNDSILDRLITSKITFSSFSSLDGLVAVSENVRRSLLSRRVDSKKIRVIPPVISEEFLCDDGHSQEMRVRLKIYDHAPVVTYIGGFEASKGLTLLLQIIAEVVSRIPKVVFIIALNIPNSDHRIKMLELSLHSYGFSRNVRLIGITDKIADILRICDVFVAPYLHTMGVADYPLAVFEAMAMSKTVIAFDVGGISSMLSEERGILIQPGDTMGFAETVVRMVNKRAEVNTMGKAASEYVAQNFYVKNVATKTIKLFEDLLDG